MIPKRFAIRTSVSALVLSLASTVFPADPAVAQSFGESAVVVEGEILIGESSSERDPGTVYRFARDGAGWSEIGTLTAPEARVRDSFGRALARSGSTLFVAAPDAAGGAGEVHAFERSGDGWRHAGILSADGVRSFGAALAAGGDHLLVTALEVGEEDAEAEGEDEEEDVAKVLAFRRSGDTWTEAGELPAPASASEGGAFGASLAVRGDLALVGAPRADGTGTAYAYRWDAEGEWQLIDRLQPPSGTAAGAGVGAAVAFFEDEILVGAPGTDRFLGAVHVFRGAPDEGVEPAGTIEPEGLASPAGFGGALAVADGTLFVGAPAVGRGIGQVHALGRTDGEWRLEGVIELEDGRLVGQVLAASGDVGVLGLPADDFGAGSAWVVSREGAGWQPEERLISEQVGLLAIAGEQIDCEEGAAERFDCDAVDLLSFVPREELGAPRGSRLNDVWGWTDPETGREYAIVGRMDGTAFVDVSDPYHPRYLGNLDRTEGSQANTWRDMKVYDDHVFIVADGAGDHGMQVFDLRQLREVTEPVEFEETALYEGVASAHNIVINEQTGFAYIVGASGGGETCGGGLHMVDIREPTNPVFAGCFAHENTGRRGTGYSHDAQCVVYHGPDGAYAGREICIGANETALSIADVTDKDAPVPLSTATYPNFAYTHQGWLTEDHRYFYSNDELDELSGVVEGTRTLVWDVSDLDDPTLVKEYYSPTKVTDHNLYVAGDRLYMSNNRSGLRVVDVSDPENPREIGFFDTTPWSEDEAGFDGTWSVYPYFESGIILLSSRREGLFVVKPREERLVP